MLSYLSSLYLLPFSFSMSLALQFLLFPSFLIISVFPSFFSSSFLIFSLHPRSSCTLNPSLPRTFIYKLYVYTIHITIQITLQKHLVRSPADKGRKCDKTEERENEKDEEKEGEEKEGEREAKKKKSTKRRANKWIKKSQPWLRLFASWSPDVGAKAFLPT